jgi:hypothetical protein
MRRRARLIRRSVATFAAALFSAAFLVIYVQLASGHDPALVANTKHAAVTSTVSSAGSTESTATAASSGESESSAGESSGSGSEETEEASSTPSPLTTSQS